MNDRPHYPWREGDALFASELNAAIANAGAVPVGGSIQAAIDALPTTGGTVSLLPNATYTVTTAINITKPNVHLFAPSWSTILRRDPAYNTAELIVAPGAGCLVEGFTVDGNSVVGTHFEAAIQGDNSTIRGMRFINGAGAANLGLAGQNSRATGNTITGPGVSLSTERGYGIWAVNHQTVMIDHNTITGTNIDGIGFDGEGTQVVGNRVSGCHCWNASQGGQIASYFGTNGNGVGAGQAVVGNTIGPPGSLAQGTGIEAWNPGMAISGNSFDGIHAAAITIFGKGTTISGNAIRNCGGTADAIVAVAGVTDFMITGNLIADQQTTPTMRYAIAIYDGASDRYGIVGNLIFGNTSSPVYDGGIGVNKTVVGNIGTSAFIVPPLPTSAVGLRPNQCWRNGTVLNII